MTDDLDTLLTQPLGEMPDNGFSARVAALVELRKLRRDRLLTEVYMGLVVLALLVLPFTPLGSALASAAFSRTGIMLIGLAAAASVFAISLSPFKRPPRSLSV